MSSHRRHQVLVSKNEIDLAIRSGRRVTMTYLEGTGRVVTATVVLRAVQALPDGDYLMFDRDGVNATVALENISSFDFA